MEEGIGVQMSKAKRLSIPLTTCFVIGVIITIAEPDLQVLANQIPGIPNVVLILAVAFGVGAFLLIVHAAASVFKVPLKYLLVFFYILAFILAYFFSQRLYPRPF